jgi:hypothetical protein
MNATLNFDLPDDLEEFTMACQAHELHTLIRDIDEELRGALKHGSHPEWDPATVDKIRAWLHTEIADRNLTIWH